MEGSLGALKAQAIFFWGEGGVAHPDTLACCTEGAGADSVKYGSKSLEDKIIRMKLF